MKQILSNFLSDSAKVEVIQNTGGMKKKKKKPRIEKRTRILNKIAATSIRKGHSFIGMIHLPFREAPTVEGISSY